MIMSGIEATLTAIPAEELRAHHQDQKDAEVAVGDEQTHQGGRKPIQKATGGKRLLSKTDL